MFDWNDFYRGCTESWCYRYKNTKIVCKYIEIPRNRWFRENADHSSHHNKYTHLKGCKWAAIYAQQGDISKYHV